MYTYHYLQPEKQWGVFQNGVFITAFNELVDAQNYCSEHNS